MFFAVFPVALGWRRSTLRLYSHGMSNVQQIKSMKSGLNELSILNSLHVSMELAWRR